MGLAREKNFEIMLCRKWSEFTQCHVKKKLPAIRGQKFHSSARNYERNLERTSNSSHRPSGRVLWEELPEEVMSHIIPLCFIGYAFIGQVHVFAGRVKIVGHSSCKTSAIFKYFCPLAIICKISVFYLACLSEQAGLS